MVNHPHNSPQVPPKLPAINSCFLARNEQHGALEQEPSGTQPSNGKRLLERLHFDAVDNHVCLRTIPHFAIYGELAEGVRAIKSLSECLPILTLLNQVL